MQREALMMRFDLMNIFVGFNWGLVNLFHLFMGKLLMVVERDVEISSRVFVGLLACLSFFFLIFRKATSVVVLINRFQNHTYHLLLTLYHYYLNSAHHRQHQHHLRQSRMIIKKKKKSLVFNSFTSPSIHSTVRPSQDSQSRLCFQQQPLPP